MLLRLQNVQRRSLRQQQQLGKYVSSSSSLTTPSDCRIAATQQWFESVVIGEKLCPFAPPLLQNSHLLRIVTSDASNTECAIRDVASQVRLLVGNSEAGDGDEQQQESPSSQPTPTHETTLVVLDNNSFLTEFRDFVRLSWELQEEAVGEEFRSELQLVLFHPKATHQTYGGEEDNPADYTIRSPYPTVHLLREMDVLRAVQSGYPNLETLPARNKEKMVKQGLDVCQVRLQACYQR